MGAPWDLYKNWYNEMAASLGEARLSGRPNNRGWNLRAGNMGNPRGALVGPVGGPSPAAAAFAAADTHVPGPRGAVNPNSIWEPHQVGRVFHQNPIERGLVRSAPRGMASMGSRALGPIIDITAGGGGAAGRGLLAGLGRVAGPLSLAMLAKDLLAADTIAEDEYTIDEEAEREDARTLMSNPDYMSNDLPSVDGRTPTSIKPGQEMFQATFPSKEQSLPEDGDPFATPDMYTVQPGDTLSQIAARTQTRGGASPEILRRLAYALAAGNNINAEKIFPGQQINLNALKDPGRLPPLPSRSPRPAASAPERYAATPTARGLAAALKDPLFQKDEIPGSGIENMPLEMESPQRYRGIKTRPSNMGPIF